MTPPERTQVKLAPGTKTWLCENHIVDAPPCGSGRYSRYSSVSDMLDVLGWTPLSQRRQEARLILFYKITNGLAQVPFEGVLVEAYKGTRRKHNMKRRQIGHTTSQYGQSFCMERACFR